MGTMFAGKSTELIRRINLLQVRNMRVLKVKFSADNRYDNKFSIVTHSGHVVEARPLTSLKDLKEEWRAYDAIAIDEGQFFTDIAEFAELAANEGKVVIVSSLQGTFFRETW